MMAVHHWSVQGILPQNSRMVAELLVSGPDEMQSTTPDAEHSTQDQPRQDDHNNDTTTSQVEPEPKAKAKPKAKTRGKFGLEDVRFQPSNTVLAPPRPKKRGAALSPSRNAAPKPPFE